MDDYSCEIVIKNNNSDAINRINGVFTLDYTKKPIPLSITKIKELNYPIHTIIRFNNYNTLDIMAFSKKQRLRPLYFDSNSLIKLKRIIN